MAGLSRTQSQLAWPGSDEWLALLLVAAFLAATVRLARDPASVTDSARKAVSRGTVVSALLIVAAFLVNRNIYNSDNYRYLIFLLTPWSLGFGLVMSDLPSVAVGRAGCRRGWSPLFCSR